MNWVIKNRRGSRIYYWTPITIQESGVYFLYRARLANYSMSGIYFETDLLLYPGAKVYVGIQDTSHRLFSEDHGSFLVNIIWRKPLTESSFNYGYGAKLTLGEAQKNSQINNDYEIKELRRNPRKFFSKPTYFTSENKYYKGAIRNISRNGVFIESEAKFSTGDELKFVVQGVNKYALLKGEIIHYNLTGFGVKFKSVLKIEKLPESKKTCGQLAV
jgi:hypothetical protein